jgi:F-type H+-transporting ATPase subunit epsilon
MLMVDLVSPNGKIYKGEADFVVAPASEGQMGILVGHEPVLTTLKKGVVKIKTNSPADEKTYEITGGFLSVYGDSVEIAADVD